MIDAHVEINHAAAIHALEDALEFSGVSRVLSVQREAGENVKKEMLMRALESGELIQGVIAQAPLDNDREMRILLDSDSREPLVCGYVTDISKLDAGAWSDDADIVHGAKLLENGGHTLDIIHAAEQLPKLLAFIDAHPSLTIVLDSCVANAQSQGDDAWLRQLREIGRRPHVHFRMSSLAPHAKSDQASVIRESIQKYFDTALHAFQPQRILYASGWSHQDFNPTYPAWINAVDDLIDHLSVEEKDAIRWENAEKVYQLA